VKATDNEPLEGVIAVIVGAEGVVDGVTAAETVDVAPVPAALVALTRNVYDVPFVKPVTVVAAVVDVPSVNVVHDPPDGKNSTT